MIKPTLPLHRWGPGRYQPASSHGDVSAFAKRQRERMAQAQMKSNVRLIKGDKR